jgi:hypothetical protein
LLTSLPAVLEVGLTLVLFGVSHIFREVRDVGVCSLQNLATVGGWLLRC